MKPSTRLKNYLICQCYKLLKGGKSFCKINTNWILQLGVHWNQYGIVPVVKNCKYDWKLRSVFEIIVIAIALIKTSAAVWFDTASSEWGAIFWGDVFYFITRNKVTWLYFQIINSLVSLYTLVILFVPIVKKQEDVVWFQFLEEIKFPSRLLMRQKHANTLIKIAAFICKHLEHLLPVEIFVFSFCYFIPYFISVNIWQLHIFGFFHCTHFFLWVLFCGEILSIQSSYFFLFCLYISWLLAAVIDKLKICKKMSPKSRFANQMLKEQIENIDRIVKMVRSCNSYFSERLKLFLVTYLFGVLVYLYRLPHAESSLDFVCMLFVIVNCVFFSASFFLSAASFKTQIIHCYSTLNSVQIKYWPHRLKWSSLLMNELVSSRRFRIGFNVKNWCTLNNFSLLKASHFDEIYFTAHMYMYF